MRHSSAAARRNSDIGPASGEAGSAMTRFLCVSRDACRFRSARSETDARRSPSLSPVLVDSRDAGRLLLPAGGKDVLDVALPFVARVLPDLVILVPVAVDGERHLPGARECLRVFERHRIVDAIWAGGREAFHHVERV